jgi:hypothetical protein
LLRPHASLRSYGIGFGIPTAAMGAAILVFVFGALIKM